MRKIILVLGMTALAAACGGLDILSLGSGVIPAIQIDRSYDLTQPDLSTCPVGDHTIQDTRSNGTVTVHVTKTQGGCSLAFAEPNLLLFDEAQARQASDALSGQTIKAVKSASVTVSDFSLTDENGQTVAIGDRISDITIVADGDTLLTKDDVTALQSGPVKKTISGPLLQKLIDGVSNHTAVTVDATATVVVPDTALSNLPKTLHLVATLQPEVGVSVTKAIAGG